MAIVCIPEFDLAGIAESGQCFRMTAAADGSVQLVALGRWLSIRPLGGDQYEISCPPQEWQAVWRDYFDLDTDYAPFRALALKKDGFLQRAAEYGAGLRILRQQPFEMLISFIISQRKSIPAIRTAVEKLCRAFGEPFDTPAGVKYAFPTPGALAAADVQTLADCGLGYRVDYVKAAAQMAADGRLELEELARLKDCQLLEILQQVPGVGVKVASCTALFGYHRLAVAPVDVWIQRVLDKVYGGKWPRRYRPALGVLQQYRFYYARCPECDFLRR